MSSTSNVDADYAYDFKSPSQIKNEIAVLLREREAVPITAAANVHNRAEQISMAKHLHAIAVKIEERELQLESIRVAEVAREHKELHPSTLGDCPICLDELVLSQITTMACCGGIFCKGCGDKPTQLGTCPLCRGDIPATPEAAFRIAKQRAEKGHAWAQLTLGNCFETGGNGANVNEEEAIRWYKLAAEQEDMHAYFLLGRIYTKRNYFAKAYQLMKKASILGVSDANSMLGELIFCGMGGVKTDMAEAAWYFTLAIADDPDDPIASCRLGSLFLWGDGLLEKSLVRAKYYLERAVKSNRAAYSLLGVALNNLTTEQYHGVSGLPGHDSIPRALYYFREATADEGNVHRSEAASRVEELEKRGQSCCANCRKTPECCPEKLKRCQRCRAVWYCATVCQRKHWRKGHKVDCIECSK